MKPVHKQIVGKAVAGESFGEISVLLGKPQPYVVKTTEISQILCLSRKTLLNVLQGNPEDERIIIRNLVQVCVQGYEQIECVQGYEQIVRHTTIMIKMYNIH